MLDTYQAKFEREIKKLRSYIDGKVPEIRFIPSVSKAATCEGGPHCLVKQRFIAT
jgi:hypothetical protein